MTQSKIGCPARAHGPSSSCRPHPRARLPHALIALSVALGGLGGCSKTDSWFDPSVVGYWEHTPTQVPILRRLNSIEGPEDEFVEVSDVTHDDLLPDAAEYRIGPGDQLQIVLWDVPSPGQPTPFDRLVDHRGCVDLPQLDEINLMDMTVEQARRVIGQRMADRNLVKFDPLVSISVVNPQQRMYTLMGAVGAPGPHYIPTSDYRMLEAIADSGGIAETVREVLVIRQVPLTEAAIGAGASAPAPEPQTKPADNERLIDLIDRLSGEKPPDQPKDQPQEQPKDQPQPPTGGSPGAFGSSDSSLVYRQSPVQRREFTPGGNRAGGAAYSDDVRTQVEKDGQIQRLKATLDGLNGQLIALQGQGIGPENRVYKNVVNQIAGQAGTLQSTREKLLRERHDASVGQPQTDPQQLNAPGTEAPAPKQPADPIDRGPADQSRGANKAAGGDSWIFVNNRWVQVRAASPQAGSTSDGLPQASDLMTQRVIRVPVAELLAGDARYNMVIRPGDIVRVPNPASGTIYLGGEINRPGAFSMAPGLTLMRVVDAAGGLSAIGIPERVDIIRMTGPERQAMIRVDLRAINEGSQPDIFMKANDRVNIGTSFWAYPLAVMRGGFRASYGYGFLLDRNFGNDVFGAPPFSNNGLLGF